MKRKIRPQGRPPVAEETVRTTVTLERSQADQLDELAREKKLSVAWLIRDAVALYLKERKGKNL